MTTASAAKNEMKIASPACLCGTKHRGGGWCAKGDKIRQEREVVDAMAAALHSLPIGTLVVHDMRTGKATARSLSDAETIVMRFHDFEIRPELGEIAKGNLHAVQYLRDIGGYVANSYGYAAQTDELFVVASSGRIAIMIHRTHAQHRPGGRGTVPDHLPSARTLAECLASGQRYSVPVLVSIARQLRLQELVDRRANFPALADSASATEKVEIDQGLSEGWLTA